MNAIASYKSRRNETASPVQIVVLLFQEMLRRIELGSVALETGRNREATEHFHHARTVIAELQSGLNPVPGAEQMVGNLASLYKWATAELTVAGREKSPERARSVSRAMVPLAEAWFTVLSQGVR